MSKRKHHTQEIAAAKAGISVRSARRIDRDPRPPSQKPRRHWRSRPDPFIEAWDTEVVPMLTNAPRLQAVTILRKLQDDHPGQYPDSVRRTLERRISHWRALAGPPKEIFFPQQHEPGARSLSDFTIMTDSGVTIAGVPFDHRLYHFVLAFSRWEYACIVEGGESFEALSNGLQNALWQAGGCPREHRTDSLSAAFKNEKEQEDFTVRYAALLEHYEMNGTRNNRGLGCSTFTVRGILYSAPSRLIGHRLKVRVYNDRLDCYLSGSLVHSTPRGSHAGDRTRKAINYRHLIDGLKRKPQAFKGLAFRDALFPREAYRLTWEQLDARLSQREACKTMVGLLELAAMDGIEAILATRLEALLAASDLPDLEALREEFAPRQADCPVVNVEMPPVSNYDALLTHGASA